jgi:hypothetical protein
MKTDQSLEREPTHLVGIYRKVKEADWLKAFNKRSIPLQGLLRRRLIPKLKVPLVEQRELGQIVTASLDEAEELRTRIYGETVPTFFNEATVTVSGLYVFKNKLRARIEGTFPLLPERNYSLSTIEDEAGPIKESDEFDGFYIPLGRIVKTEYCDEILETFGDQIKGETKLKSGTIKVIGE